MTVTRDAVFALIVLLLAGAYYTLAGGLPTSTLADSVGPAGLPRMYALVAAALALVALAAGPGRAGHDADPHERHAGWRVAGLLIIGVVYVGVVPVLGYLASMALLLLATIWYQGGVLDRRGILVAAGGAVFLWLLFVVFLGIPQPPGVWAELF